MRKLIGLFLLAALLANPALALKSQRYAIRGLNACKAGTVSFYDTSGGNATWTTMPNALTFFRGQGQTSTRYVDLTGCTEVQLSVMTSSTASETGAYILLKYLPLSSGYNATVGNWTQLGQNADVSITVAGTTSSMLQSGWQPLATAAQGKTLLVLAGGGAASGLASPTFGAITMQYR